MDKIRNPYSPGAGNPPPDLVGRDQEIESFDVAIQRLTIGRSAKSLMLTGLRGVGKTVLLREFGSIARSRGWVHSQIEATENLRFVEGVSILVHKALLRLSARHRIRDRLRKVREALSNFEVRYEVPGLGDGVVVSPGASRIAGLGVLDEDLADLFVEVGDAARKAEVGVLLTVDEMQHLSRPDMAALIVGLHRVSQEQLPLMLAGAGLPSLPGFAGEAKSYAERLFDFPVIDSLEREDAELALSRPADKEGVAWAEDALELAYSRTEGYPYFLQEFGKQAWEIAKGPDTITRDDVERSSPIAINELDINFFRTRLDRINDSGRNYLRSMASLGAGPYKSGDVADRLAKTTSLVGPVREALLKRGLIYSPRWGYLDFTVPMFDQYVVRTLGLNRIGQDSR